MKQRTSYTKDMQLMFKESRPEKNAVSFIFEPLKPLTWQAGQSIKIEVPGPYGPLEHRFSIASAPYEKNVMITTRLSGSPYKNSLAALKPGDIVDAYGLEGDFVWQEGTAPHIFLAAGIGITAFRSMLMQRAHEQKPLTATLLYGSSQEFVFKEDLNNLARRHPEYTVHYYQRRLEVNDIPQTDGLLYLSGPSAFVDEMSTELLRRGIAEQQLMRDWFTGRLSH
jgi:ferredoxin-NADP reductase